MLPPQGKECAVHNLNNCAKQMISFRHLEKQIL